MADMVEMLLQLEMVEKSPFLLRLLLFDLLPAFVVVVVVVVAVAVGLLVLNLQR